MEENNQERSFKGVWIPKEIWLNNELTLLDKVILIEIDSLDDEKEHCYASNQYLAEFCNCTETKVSVSIKKLKELGYIEQLSFDGRKRILKSRLKENLGQTLKNLKADFKKSDRQTLKNLKADFKKIKPINIYNNIDNNIETNIDNNSNIYSPAKAEPLIPFDEIIDYLNSMAHTNYKSTTKKTRDLIKARYNEGFTLEDFKIVIEKKTLDWYSDKNMSKYLRPETLFGNKFEGYLNQKERELTTKDLAEFMDFSTF